MNYWQDIDCDCEYIYDKVQLNDPYFTEQLLLIAVEITPDCILHSYLIDWEQDEWTMLIESEISRRNTEMRQVTAQFYRTTQCEASFEATA